MEILFIVAAICFVLALVALFIFAGIRLVRALVATLFRKPADQAKPGPALTVTVETRPVRPARSGNRKPPKPRTADWPALLDRDDVLVVDTETTGLGGTAEVVEVGVVDTTGKVRLHVLSMPQSRMPREASAIHGLTRAVLRKRDAQPWPEVHAAVVEVLTAADVVLAWNAAFDERLLRQTAERHGIAFPDLTWRCVQRDYGGKKALVVAAVDVGLTVRHAHSALTDAERIVDVLRAMPAARKRNPNPNREPNKCAPHRWLLPDHGADALTCEKCGRYLEAGAQVNGAMPGIIANIANLHNVPEADVLHRLSHPAWKS